MKSKSMLWKGISLFLVLATLLISTSCGTVIYPERRGQAAGRVDAAVAALDAVGLLFFLVPGVIAFAVDFATGAIYLPPGASGYGIQLPTSGLEGSQTLRARKESLTRHDIENLIQKKTGVKIDLTAPE